MADTAFRQDDNLTNIQWAAALFRDALQKTFFGKFVGSTSSSLVHTKTDLTKDVGDQIRFGLRMKLSGQGRSDDQDFEGHEESLTFHDWPSIVHLRGNAVVSAGKMTNRRTKFNIMSEGRLALSDWMKDLIDDDTVLALSGLANPAIFDDDGTIVPAVSPSTNRKTIGGGKVDGTGFETGLTDATLDADNLFTTLMIQAMRRKAILASPKVRPLMVDGKEHFVCFAHPYQTKSLKAETAWREAQQHANIRGMSNPIFSGAIGMYDGVIIHEYERIQTRTGDGVGTDPTTYFESADPVASGITAARALFCGAQAGTHAYAQRAGWYTKNFQYGRVPGVMTDLIYAAGKPRFNSEDYGIITVDTAVVVD